MSADASTVRAKTATVVKTVKYSKFGTIFVNTEAFALYISSKDTKNHSNCTGQCIALWPPLVVPAGVTPIGKGVSGLGVATRPSGQHQVTYKNTPLYLFVSDKKRGQVTGQGVSGFSVVKPGAANTRPPLAPPGPAMAIEPPGTEVLVKAFPEVAGRLLREHPHPHAWCRGLTERLILNRAPLFYQALIGRPSRFI